MMNMMSYVSGVCCTLVVMYAMEDVSGMLMDVNSRSELKSELSCSSKLFSVIPLSEQEIGMFSNDDVSDENSVKIEYSIVDVANEFCENLQSPTEETEAFLKTVPEFKEHANGIPWRLFNSIAESRNPEAIAAAVSIKKTVGECPIYNVDPKSLVGQIIHQSDSEYDMLFKLGGSFTTFEHGDQLIAMAQFRHYSIHPVEYQTKNSWGRLEYREYCDSVLMDMARNLYDYFFWRMMKIKIF